jgi:carotenoid cleavage dioxygenase-like enzyme
VPRYGTAKDIKWFRGPAMGVGHTMNAFRSGNTVHLDATVYDGNMFTFFPVAKNGVVDYPPPSAGDGQAPVPPILSRLSFDLDGNSGDFTRTVLARMPGEMPRTDDRIQGRAYRHGYLIVRPRIDANRAANLESAIGHVDHNTGALKIWEPGANRSVHEPQFVPRDPAAPEGEGWLLVIVNRLDENCNDLVILDAQKIEAGPIATVRVPLKIRATFHGCWIPG